MTSPEPRLKSNRESMDDHWREGKAKENINNY